MNVRVPGEGEIAPFWVIVGVLVALGVGLLALFRGRPLAVSGARHVAPRPPAGARGDGLDREVVEEQLQAGESFWLDLVPPTEEELGPPQRPLRFHPLAVEDSEHFGQRPKVEDYDDFVFLVVYGWSPDDDGLVEVHCFYSERYLVTVHRDASPTLDGLREQARARPGPLPGGARCCSTR